MEALLVSLCHTLSTWQNVGLSEFVGFGVLDFGRLGLVLVIMDVWIVRLWNCECV